MSVEYFNKVSVIHKTPKNKRVICQKRQKTLLFFYLLCFTLIPF